MTDEAVEDIQCLRQLRSNIRTSMEKQPLTDNKSQPLIPMAPYLMDADIHSGKKKKKKKQQKQKQKQKKNKKQKKKQKTKNKKQGL